MWNTRQKKRKKSSKKEKVEQGVTETISDASALSAQFQQHSEYPAPFMI